MCIDSALQSIRLSDPGFSGEGYEYFYSQTNAANWCGRPVVIDETEYIDILDANLDVIFAHADKESIASVVLMEDIVSQSSDNLFPLPEEALQSDGWNLVAAVNVTDEPMVSTISVDRSNLDVLGFREFVEGGRTPWTSQKEATLEDGNILPTTTVVVFIPPRSSRGVFALRLRPPLPPGLDLEGDALINHLTSQVEILTDYIDKNQMSEVIKQSNLIESQYKGGTLAICLPLPVPSDPDAAYLITQGFGGRLTHYLPPTLYSIDLRADLGTPVISPDSGVVVKISDRGTKASGIHVSNLYSFSSMMIKLDTKLTAEGINQIDLDNKIIDRDLYLEFTHIMDYDHMKVGQRISKGERIASVGKIGFAPEPHLHLQVYLSDSDEALPIRFKFKNIDTFKSTVPLTLIKHLAKPDNDVVIPMTGMALRPLELSSNK